MTLAPLPYALDALEPHISRRTLAAHYGEHHAAYVEKTRSLVKGSPLESASLEDIVRRSAKRADRALFNAAAQAWNHAFYWRCMRPDGGGEARGPVASLIKSGFGSYSKFCEEFVKTSVDQFGSGWAWLVLDGDRLQMIATSNAETPLVNSQLPLLAIDVWEHAYYLDYQHRRHDYIEAYLTNLVDWEFANHNLSLASSVRAQGPPKRVIAARRA